MQTNIRNIIIGCAIFAQVISTLQGDRVKPHLSADKLFEDKGIAYAQGNALLKYNDILVEADEVKYLRNENIIEANGKIRLTNNDLRLAGDKLSYQLNTGHFKLDTFRIGVPPYHGEGNSLNGTKEKINLGKSTIYLQTPGAWALNIKSSAATLYSTERLEAKDVTFRIGRLPFFYLPKISQPLKESMIRFKGNIGHRSNLGAYFQSDILFPINDSLRIGSALDIYTQRGLLIGPAVDYSLKNKRHSIESRFRSGYIDDHGNKGTDVAGNNISEDRFYIEYKHQQSFDNRFYLNSSISIWEDSETERDFRPDLFRDNQQPDSFIEGTYIGKNFFLSTFTRIKPNDFQAGLERLPEFRFDSIPTPILNSNIYQSINAGIARLVEHPLSGAPKIESNRYDLLYSLTDNFKFRNSLTIRPVSSFRLTHYSNTTGDRKNFTRIMGEFGFDAEFQYQGIWNYQNTKWKINGLRHLLRPNFSYRYHPGGLSGNNDIIAADRDVFTTSLPSIDLTDIRHIDELIDQHTLRFGLENLLQTRDDTYGSRDLLELNFYQDLNLTTNPGEDEWAFFYTQFASQPAPWLSVHLTSRITPENLTLQDISSGISVNDGDIWKLTFSSVYLQNEIDQYYLTFDYRINNKWKMGAKWRFDARLDELTEQRYALRQRIANAWDIEYHVSIHNGSTREDETSIGVKFYLLQF